MRLFLALAVSDAIRQDAIELRARVTAEAPDAAGGLRWVDPMRMHLTVRFIGEVDQAVTDRLMLRLREPVPVAPFEYDTASIAWLPGPSRPRVLVRGIARGVERIRAVAEYADRLVLEEAHLPAESRGFTPHVTLARVRDESRRAVAAGVDAVTRASEQFARRSTAASELTLFRSVTGPRGPTYDALARAHLAEAAP